MAERFQMWLGAGLVTAGVAAAMIAGAGAAFADNPPGSGATGASSSESTKPAESKADSDNDDTTPKPSTGSEDARDTTPDETERPTQRGEEEPAATDKKPTGSGTSKKTTHRPAKPIAAEKATTKPTVKHVAPEPEEPKSEGPVAAATAPAVQSAAAVVPVARAALEAQAAQSAAVAFAAPAAAQITSTAAASPLSGLISAIGTLVFNLYGVAIRVFGGPPTLPPNSSVTVRSSTLRLDCGCGDGNSIEVPADWYVPDTATPPDRLIYLQHGFLAAGPWYSHTAAALAEQTKSIVVAPSITSNFFASDGCWLGAPPMQKAVADLFEADNTALAESALAAGYTGPIPDRVVLIGHSLGGGLVAGTAGEMVDNNTVGRLAGVVMLDGVAFDDSMAASLDKVPDGVPIYQLAAPKYFWNEFGIGTEALLQARPGQFIGVTLVGGSHVDSMRGGNPLIQFSQQLVSGFSKPQNVAAARIVMVGWVNDMFAGNQKTGIYLEPDERFNLDTPAGRATLVDLPNSLTKPFLLNPLHALMPLGNGFFKVGPTCSPVVAVCAAKTQEESVAA